MTHAYPETGAAWWRPVQVQAVAPGHVADAQSPTSRVAFGALVAFTAILLLSPQIWFPVLGTLRIAFLAAGLAIGAHLVQRLARPEPAPFFPEIAIAATLVTWSIITIPVSYWPGGSVEVLSDRYLKAVAFFWLIGTVVTTTSRLRVLAWAFVLCSIPLAITGIHHYVTGMFLRTGVPGLRRIYGYEGGSGLVSNPNDLALMLNLILPIAGSMIVSAKSMSARCVAALAAALSAIAVVLTFSRAGFLTLATTSVLFAWWLLRSRAPGKAAVLLIAGLCTIPYLPQGYADRLSTITDIETDQTGSATGRWRDYQVALGVVVQNPIFGAGIGQDILAMNEYRGDDWVSVHNAFLEYAVDLGVPGLVLFVWLYLTCLRSARAVERQSLANPAARDLPSLAGGVRIALLAFGVAAFFHPIAYQFYFFSIGGLAVALKHAYLTEQCERARSRQSPVVSHQSGGSRARSAAGSSRGLVTMSISVSLATGARDADCPPAVVPASAAPVRLMKVVPTLLCGGTESQVMTLCRSLDRAHFDLEFACLRRLGPFVKELAERGHPLEEYRLASFRSVEAVRQQLRFSRHLAKRDVQIVHAYNFYGNVFAIPPARLARTPVVIASIRDLGLYLTPSQKRLQRHVCRLADCVVVNAAAVKTWLVGEGYSPERIVVINNGVDLTRFDGPSEPERVRRELGVPEGAPLVAVVSRLSRMKGLEQFLEGAAVVRRRWPDARFLIIGETPVHDPAYLDDLKRHARAFGLEDRVIFTGLRSDVATLLQSVNVAVMPSLNEALSNALLESMAAGAPVVATRVGGTPEALIDGETGLLVPPGDVGALSIAVGRLLADPALAARLGCAARAAIAARFSVTRMTDTTARLYQDLLTYKARSRGRLSRRRFSIERDRMTWLQQSLP